VDDDAFPGIPVVEQGTAEFEGSELHDNALNRGYEDSKGNSTHEVSETIARLGVASQDACSCDELVVEVYVEKEMVYAEVDTAARSLWVNADWFEDVVGNKVVEDKGDVFAADSAKVEVYGASKMDFELWGRRFYNYPVRLLKNLKPKILIGRAFWVEHKATLFLNLQTGSITISGKTYAGRILYGNCGQRNETVKLMGEEDAIDESIQSIDLSGFSPDAELQEKLRLLIWKKRHLFKGVGSIKNIQHRIKLKEGA